MASSYNQKTVSDSVIFCVDTHNPKSYVSGSAPKDIIDMWSRTVTGSFKNGVGLDSNGELQFDGTDDYIRFGSVPKVGADYSSSFEMWYNYSSSVDGNIFSVGNVANSVSYMVIFADWASSTTHRVAVTMATQLSGSWQLKSNAPFPSNNAWHHIVITKTAGGNTGNFYNCKMYIDGKLYSAAFSTNTMTGDWWINNFGMNRTAIGTGIRSANFGYYKNKIGYVKVHDRVLTAEEVKYNYIAHRNRYS